MAYKISSGKKIVMMSKDLMDLYDFHPLAEGLEFQPMTFLSPQECLEMLVSTEELEEEELFEESTSESHKKIQKQWGELELRLSFFTDALNWQ
jgi:hypothetical protein